MTTLSRNVYGAPLLDRTVDGDRRIWFRLVTPAIDRHGTIIRPEGVDLTNHRSNPVFLWMHQSSAKGGIVVVDKTAVALPSPPQPPPDVVIGQVVDYDQTRDHLDICVEFDSDPMADLCYQKVRRGFLRMVSIGANVIEETTVEVDGEEVPEYTRTELVEASLVIIGSNRQALALDRAGAVELVRSIEAPLPEVVAEAAAGAADAEALRDGAAAVVEAAIEQAEAAVDAAQAALEQAEELAGVAPHDEETEKPGVMICVYPDAVAAAAVALADGLPAEGLHCTLAYVKPDGLPEGWEEKLTVTLRRIADVFGPLQGELAGVGRFSASDTSDGLDVVHVVPDVPRLLDLCGAVRSELGWQGFAVSKRHGWAPHVTLAYVKPADASPITRIDPVPVAFLALSFTSGGLRRDFNFAMPDAVSAVADRSAAEAEIAEVAPAAEVPAPVDPELARVADRSADLAPQGDRYLASESQDTGARVAPSKVDKEPRMPITMTPDCRFATRMLISHALDGAEMHAQMAEGIAPTEHRALHREAAVACLDRAAMLSSTYRSAMGTDEDEDGVARSAPELADVELRAKFAEVTRAAGKLPKTARQVVRAVFGSEDVEAVETEVMALRAAETDLRTLRGTQKTEAQRAAASRREELIAQYLDPATALISPAEAATMRGVDPATGTAVGEAWKPERIEAYVARRMAQGAGPLAPITRTAPLAAAPGQAATPTPGAAPLVPGARPAAPAAPSLVRVANRGTGGRAAAQALIGAGLVTEEELVRSAAALSGTATAGGPVAEEITVE